MKRLLILSAFLLFTYAKAYSQEETPPPAVKIVPTTVDSTDVWVDFPDVEPDYAGGGKALQAFISEHIKYPEEALKNNISGRVYLKFTVEADGTISHIVVERGVHPLLDKEAKRVVEMMPAWIPGELKGKKVPTKARLPIIFAI